MPLILNDGVLISTPLPCYGTTAGGDTYFSTRLNPDAWEDASEDRKVRALQQATRAIDRLNFAGSRASSDQILQFPRGTDSSVPFDVECACYEEAIRLLDGVEPEREMANLAASSQGFAAVRTTYDRTSVPENVRAGIMSAVAWTLILPYLREPRSLTVSRV